jgi:hypothetical protein
MGDRPHFAGQFYGGRGRRQAWAANVSAKERTTSPRGRPLPLDDELATAAALAIKKIEGK